MEPEVVVAGGGPVGLLLAGELALGGVRVSLLERQAEPDQPVKMGAMGARSINAPSADALHRRGLLNAVRDAAIWWYDPAGPVAEPPPFVGHFAGIPIRAD